MYSVMPWGASSGGLSSGLVPLGCWSAPGIHPARQGLILSHYRPAWWQRDTAVGRE